MFEQYTPETLGRCKFAGVFDAGTSEWHELRAVGLGGSDIAVVMGLSPWRSAYSLWAEKTGQVIPEPLDSDPVMLGNLLEEPLLQMFAHKHPELELFTTGTYVDGFMVANPDALAKHRYTGEWFVVEVKTSAKIMPEIPTHYRSQVMWYQHLLGIERAYLVGLAAGRWMEHTQDYDAFEASAMESAAKRFWKSVEDVARPDWDGSSSTYETVRREVLSVDDSNVNLGDYGIELVNAWANFDEAESRLNLVKSQVLAEMGAAKFGVVDLDEIPRHTVVSRQVGRNGVPFLRKVK